MAIKKSNSGWRVDIMPGGRAGRRIRKTFSTRAEALAWERHIQAQSHELPGWMPPKKDNRRLTDLVEIWFRHHGSGLRAGDDTYKRLLTMCKAMGNPLAEVFAADQFAEYRTRRISSGITPNNMNREQAYLRAVFNELIRLGYWQKENPLKKLRAFKIQEQELSYLTHKQIGQLIDALKASTNVHAQLITRICLETGARWSEAETLRRVQIRDKRIQFAQTKSSRIRIVPIRHQLEEAISVHHLRYGSDERIFTYAYSAFREAIERANISLPKGQLSHVLRHTFASHFMMNGGNILALQHILGHSDLKMTMRYAHLAPEHLETAVSLNPLAKFSVDVSLTLMGNNNRS